MHDAVDKLAAEERSLAELVKLRFFAGLTSNEVAEVPSVSEPTGGRSRERGFISKCEPGRERRRCGEKDGDEAIGRLNPGRVSLEA